MLTRLVDMILRLPPDVLGEWGYAILFVASFAESLPLIGMAVPGGIIVIASGFFAKLGILNLTTTLIIAIIGAFLGDLIAYFLGRKYGYDLLLRLGRFIFIKPSYFERAKRLLNNHPGKSLIVGRFHAITRAIMPFAAGSLDIPFTTFLLFDA